MSFIGRFFIVIFGVLGGLMLFIMLFRLNNSNGAYIGLSDIYYFFKMKSDEIAAILLTNNIVSRMK